MIEKHLREMAEKISNTIPEPEGCEMHWLADMQLAVDCALAAQLAKAQQEPPRTTDEKRERLATMIFRRVVGLEEEHANWLMALRLEVYPTIVNDIEERIHRAADDLADRILRGEVPR